MNRLGRGRIYQKAESNAEACKIKKCDTVRPSIIKDEILG